uniref:SigF-like NTF2-like domain-containing protein n=2 Tax=Schizophyllum commune (strain H4-8 / FGSC 9210) TaxID=578458 RepID=D8Q780_SCHCM
MENPAEDIHGVFNALTMAANADVQRAAVNKYFLPNAGFRHPLCRVEPGFLSRDNILGVYQWYRIMSPILEAEIIDVVFHPDKNVMYLEGSQKFHIRLSPFAPAPARIIIRLTLQKDQFSGLYYIAQQEDFYHPDDFINLLVPPLAPFIRLALDGAGVVSNICAKVGQVVGYWRPGGGPHAESGEDVCV